MPEVSILNLDPITPGDNTPANVLAIVDVADTTQGPSGSTVNILMSDLFKMENTPITSNAPIIDARQTWNAAGVTFTALKLDITNSASATGSLLVDMQVGSSTRFSVTKAGKATITDGTAAGGPGTSIVLGLTSSVTGSASSGAALGLLSYAKQTVASTGSVQGAEGYAHCAHTSGTVVLAIGVPANVEVSGAGGTTTWARGVQGGGALTAGTVTNYASVYAAAPATGATVSKAYGVYVDAVSIGSSENWSFYSTNGNVSFRTSAIDPAATTGHFFIPTCAGTPTGVPSSIPTGQAAFQYDTASKSLYIYDVGVAAWRYVATTS